MHPIEYRTLTEKDPVLLAQALAMLNRTQGDGLFPPNYLLDRVRDDNSKVFSGIAGGQVFAVGVAQLIDQFDYYHPFSSELASELISKRVGSFSTLSVLESVCGQGVGQKMGQLRLDWLQSQQCHVVLGVSWVSGLQHTSDRVFDKLGFRAVKKVDKFYCLSSHIPFDCPGCQVRPCTCAAILYRLDLQNKP